MKAGFYMKLCGDMCEIISIGHFPLITGEGEGSLIRDPEGINCCFLDTLNVGGFAIGL